MSAEATGRGDERRREVTPGDEAGHDRSAVELPASDEALLAECDVETFRAGGPGGQHQNVTDSAVRLRHRPTGIVVTCRAQRSQFQNKQTCLRRLREKAAKLGERPTPRVPTKPSRAAAERRLEEKARRARVKRARAAPASDD